MHLSGNVCLVWKVKEAPTSDHFQVTMGSEISSNRDHADAMDMTGIGQSSRLPHFYKTTKKTTLVGKLHKALCGTLD